MKYLDVRCLGHTDLNSDQIINRAKNDVGCFFFSDRQIRIFSGRCLGVVQMRDPDKSGSVNRPQRKGGPRILMTESEYAEAKRLATKHGKSLSSYIRLRALSHRTEAAYSKEEIESIKRAGFRFNAFVRQLHIHPDVVSGLKPGNRIHVDDVASELSLLGEALSATPWRTWRSPVKQFPKGEGKRINRGKVRCTPEEQANLRAMAQEAGMKNSVFIRAIIFNHAIGKKTFRDITYQVNRIQNNLRQMMNIRKWEPDLESQINTLLDEVDRRRRDLIFGRERQEK